MIYIVYMTYCWCFSVLLSEYVRYRQFTMNVNHFLRPYLGVYFLEAKDLEFLRSECGSQLWMLQWLEFNSQIMECDGILIAGWSTMSWQILEWHRLDGYRLDLVTSVLTVFVSTSLWHSWFWWEAPRFGRSPQNRPGNTHSPSQPTTFAGARCLLYQLLTGRPPVWVGGPWGPYGAPWPATAMPGWSWRGWKKIELVGYLTRSQGELNVNGIYIHVSLYVTRI